MADQDVNVRGARRSFLHLAQMRFIGFLNSVSPIVRKKPVIASIGDGANDVAMIQVTDRRREEAG
eukprot:756272-Hanusia_phi.AAC.3